MAKPKQPVKRLYQRVADALAREIRSGKVPVGGRLPAERDLASRFTVSRPTVREAIIALEIAGMVEVKVGSGVYVKALTGGQQSATELDIGPFELTEARRLIERETAALAASLVGEVDIANLERIIGEMEEENRQGIEGEAADREFHLTIARATQNSALVSAVELLWDVRETSPMCVTMLKKVRKVGVQPTIADHRTILEALKKHDPDAARRAMDEHLTRVIAGLLEATEVEAMEKARQEIEARRARYRV